MSGASHNEAAMADYLDRYAPRLERWMQLRTPRWLRGAIDCRTAARAALSDCLPPGGQCHDVAEEVASVARARAQVQDRLAWAACRASEGLRCAGETERVLSADSMRATDVSSSLLQRYDAALTHLRRADREAIILRLELGLPWTEVVTLLEKTSAPAAKIAVCRALVRLAREMAS
jgi:RNA polymerase sigma-70 factor (ECF subfamily)